MRKINFCFVRNRDGIAKYFDSRFYSCDTPLSELHPLSTKSTQHLSSEDMDINLIYAIEEGEIGESTYQKVTLDSDIYITAQTQIERILLDKSAMNDINETLFRIYLNTVSDRFLELLTSDDDLCTDEILGVEPNE